MNKLSWRTVLALLVLFAGFGAGCGKKAETTNSDTTGSSAQPPTATASKSTSAKLSESQEVMAAIDRKDYDGAIATLLRIRQSVANAEQQMQFANLYDEVRIKLIEAAPTQPKAAEALAVLRKITGGR
jgi:uncharacterized protein with beta-barrel porin domain